MKTELPQIRFIMKRLRCIYIRWMRDWFGEELFSWLGQELHYETLAAGLRQCYRSTKDIFRCAEQILQASGNYGAEEMEQIHQLLEAMNGKTAMERRKMRGDLLLEAKKYRQAAYIYMELLEPEYTRQLYLALHPEDADVKESDFKLVTL